MAVPIRLRRAPTARRRTGRRAVCAMVAGVALCAAACTGTTDGDVTTAGAGDAPTASTPDGTDPPAADTAPTTEARGELGSGETVTIAFGGDSSFQDLEGGLQSNPDALLDPIEPTLSGADLAMVNLEAALTTGGTPAPKTFNFRVPPSALDALAAGGVDVVSMANNHGMDYGADGLEESLSIRSASETERGIAVLGIGADENDAYAPWITEVKGQRIGFIAANDVFDSSLQASWTAGPSASGLASSKEGDRQDRLVAEVQRVRPEVDTLVVYLHMGVEKDTCPTQRQEALTDALHAAGADLVIGTHTHRLQGAGFRNGEFVAYGLGNYVFRGPSAESRKAATLLVDVTGQRVDGYRWEPATLENNVPVPISGEAADAALAELDEKRQCAGLEAAAPVDAGTASTTSADEETP